MHGSQPADARQRAHLKARRIYLAIQVNMLREQALELWRQSHVLRANGEDSLTIEYLALDAQDACYRINRALLAIGNELGEGVSDQDDTL